MAEKRWKRAEREVAALLGGVRVPITGRSRGSAPDVAHPYLSLEVKTREELPAWLHEAMTQAQAAAKPDQLPLAVLHEVGAPYRDALCVVRLEDWVEWFGPGFLEAMNAEAP